MRDDEPRPVWMSPLMREGACIGGATLDLWRIEFAEPQSPTGPEKRFKEVTAAHVSSLATMLTWNVCFIVCVFITAGPITKLFAGGEEESGGHAL